MNDSTVPVRVAAAKHLLLSGASEYDELPARCRAHLQEAIEFLTQVEADLEGAGPKK